MGITQSRLAPSQMEGVQRMKLHRLRDASLRIEDGRALANLRFETGEQWAIDFTERSRNRPKLKPILDPETFLAGEIAEGGMALEWPCGIDIDATALYRHAQAMQLRQWRRAHGMSQKDAAEALGLTGRTVQTYEAGEREIPRTVILAMRGYDASPELRRA